MNAMAAVIMAGMIAAGALPVNTISFPKLPDPGQLWEELSSEAEAVAGSLAEKADKLLDAAGDTIGGAVNAAGEAIGGAVDAARGAIGGAVDTAGETIGGAVDTAGETIDGASEKISEAAENFAGTVSETAGAVSETVEERTREAVGHAEEMGRKWRKVMEYLKTKADRIHITPEEWDRLEEGTFRAVRNACRAGWFGEDIRAADAEAIADLVFTAMKNTYRYIKGETDLAGFAAGMAKASLRDLIPTALGLASGRLPGRAVLKTGVKALRIADYLVTGNTGNTSE